MDDKVQTKASGGVEPERRRPGARGAARRLELAGAAVTRREERRHGSREKDEEEEALCERGARGERRRNAHTRAWMGQRGLERSRIEAADDERATAAMGSRWRKLLFGGSKCNPGEFLVSRIEDTCHFAAFLEPFVLVDFRHC